MDPTVEDILYVQYIKNNSCFQHSLRMNIWVQNGEGIQGLTKCDRRTPSSILIQPSPPHGYQTIATIEEMGGGGQSQRDLLAALVEKKEKKLGWLTPAWRYQYVTN